MALGIAAGGSPEEAPAGLAAPPAGEQEAATVHPRPEGPSMRQPRSK